MVLPVLWLVLGPANWMLFASPPCLAADTFYGWFFLMELPAMSLSFLASCCLMAFCLCCRSRLNSYTSPKHLNFTISVDALQHFSKLSFPSLFMTSLLCSLGKRLSSLSELDWTSAMASFILTVYPWILSSVPPLVLLANSRLALSSLRMLRRLSWSD